MKRPSGLPVRSVQQGTCPNFSSELLACLPLVATAYGQAVFPTHHMECLCRHNFLPSAYRRPCGKHIYRLFVDYDPSPTACIQGDERFPLTYISFSFPYIIYITSNKGLCFSPKSIFYKATPAPKNALRSPPKVQTLVTHSSMTFPTKGHATVLLSQHLHFCPFAPEKRFF
jgi:hypothetical protein